MIKWYITIDLIVYTRKLVYTTKDLQLYTIRQIRDILDLIVYTRKLVYTIRSNI